MDEDRGIVYGAPPATTITLCLLIKRWRLKRVKYHFKQITSLIGRVQTSKYKILYSQFTAIYVRQSFWIYHYNSSAWISLLSQSWPWLQTRVIVRRGLTEATFCFCFFFFQYSTLEVQPCVMNKGGGWGGDKKKWKKRLKIEREHENHVSVRRLCASIKNTQENITAAKKKSSHCVKYWTRKRHSQPALCMRRVMQRVIFSFNEVSKQWQPSGTYGHVSALGVLLKDVLYSCGGCELTDATLQQQRGCELVAAWCFL